jgi:tetratricopeptide (TPR) repeat protein
MNYSLKLTSILFLVFIASSGLSSQQITILELNQSKALSAGMTALAEKRYDAAATLLREALSNNIRGIRRSAILSNLCAVDYLRQQYKDALASCDEALKISRSNWRSFLNRGNVHLALGNTVAAEKDYKAAQQLNADMKIMNKALKSLTEVKKRSVKT